MNTWYFVFIIIIVVYAGERRAVRMRMNKMIAAGRNQRRLLAEGRSPSEICETAVMLREHIGEIMAFSCTDKFYRGFKAGTVKEVKGCWAEIETRTGRELINLNCYTEVSPLPEKYRTKAFTANV